MRIKITKLLIVLMIPIFCFGQNQNYTDLEIKTEQCLDQFFQDHDKDLHELKSIFELYYASREISNAADPLYKQYKDILKYWSNPLDGVPDLDTVQQVQQIKEILGLSKTDIVKRQQLECFYTNYLDNKSTIGRESAFYLIGSSIEGFRKYPDISPGLIAITLSQNMSQADLQKELYQKSIVLLFCFNASFTIEDFEDELVDIPNTIIPITQKSNSVENNVYDQNGNSENVSDEDLVFAIVEHMPEFPGGQEVLYEYIRENLTYPSAAYKKGIEGKVYVTFVVDRDGSVTEVKLLRGIGGGCDEEAMRVIREMPKWNAGMQKGKAVRVQYNLPIRFELTKSQKRRMKK